MYSKSARLPMLMNWTVASQVPTEVSDFNGAGLHKILLSKVINFLQLCTDRHCIHHYSNGKGHNKLVVVVAINCS